MEFPETSPCLANLVLALVVCLSHPVCPTKVSRLIPLVIVDAINTLAWLWIPEVVHNPLSHSRGRLKLKLNTSGTIVRVRGAVGVFASLLGTLANVTQVCPLLGLLKHAFHSRRISLEPLHEPWGISITTPTGTPKALYLPCVEQVPNALLPNLPAFALDRVFVFA